MSFIRKNSRVCEICTQSKGTDFCNECEQVFCQNCKLLHIRTKSNRFHTFRNVDFSHKEMEFPICAQHNEEFGYFCEKCDEPTCKVCIFTVHKGHNMSDLSETVAKKKKELSSTWEVYLRKLEGARKSVDNMENSLHTYRKKVYNTIKEIESEGEKLRNIIDKTVSDMAKELREKEAEEMKRVTHVINGLKSQLERGIQLERHINKALKLKDDTSMLISLKKFQEDMASYIPEVILPCEFSYLKGNAGSAHVHSMLGRIFFENDKSGRETPLEAKDDFNRNARKYELWACPLCNTERYIDRMDESERSFKTPRCCYGFMQSRGIAYK